MLKRDFSKLLKKKTADEILTEFVFGKYGKLTDKQLDKVLEMRGKRHGGFAFKKEGKKWLNV